MAPMATDGQEPVGSMGNDTPLAVLSRPPAVALQLLQAALRPGHQPAARRDSRGDHHIDDHHDRLRRKPAGRDARAVPAAAARQPDPRQPRAGEDQSARPATGFKSRTLSTLFPAPRRRRRACAAGWTSCAHEAIAGDRRRRHDPDPLRPRREPRHGADSRAAGHQRRASSPGPRRHAHALRPGRRNRRSPRGASLRPAHRLRRRRGQSVPGVRHARRRCWPRTTSPTEFTHEEAGEELHQGRRQGPAQGDVQDGHLHAAELPRRTDLRGHRPEQRVRRRVLHLDRQPHPRRRPRDDRRRIAPPPRARLSRASNVPQLLDLDVGGQYQWRRKGEAHIFSPDVVAKLQHATRINSRDEFKQVLRADRRPAAAAAHAPRPAGVQAGRAARSAGRSRAGQGDRQAVRHRRHVLRLDLARKRTRRWPSP